MKLDGTNRHKIVSTNKRFTNSLTIDFVSSRLYWAATFVVESTDLEGGNRSLICSTNSRRPTALALYNEKLYFAEWKFDRIATCATDRMTSNRFVNDVKKTAAIRVVEKSKQQTLC